MTPVRLEPAALQSRVKHSTTEPLRSLCFDALSPKSIAMVMAGQSVHKTALFLGKLEQAVDQYFLHIFSLVTVNNPS